MAQYSKKRGVNYDKQRLSMDEKRRQWNVDIAKRQLEHMFGQVDLGDEIIINRVRRSYLYARNTL